MIFDPKIKVLYFNNIRKYNLNAPSLLSALNTPSTTLTNIYGLVAPLCSESLVNNSQFDTKTYSELQQSAAREETNTV